MLAEVKTLLNDMKLKFNSGQVNFRIGSVTSLLG